MTKDEHKSKHPWRENFEGLSLAIVMALTLKYFVLEAYKIPTGSMQPTLMGVDQPELQIFDRILVDKLAYLLREPERWEVIVFKYPLDQSKNYIKRLVGLSGETVRIQNGNLYAKSDSRGAFRIARKPKDIQETLWKDVYHLSHEAEHVVPQGEFWKEESGGWEFVGADLFCVKPGTISYRKPILDYYADGYPQAIRASIEKGQREPSHNAVGDVRISCMASPNPATRALSGVIDTGLHRYEFRVAGPAGNGEAEIFADGKSLGRALARMDTARAARIRFAHWDETLELEVDGETVLRAELPAFFDERSSVAKFPVSLSSEGGGMKISELKIERDIHYTAPSGQTEWQIPVGRYFFLGDNTQNSYDGRLWQASLYRIRDASEGGTIRSLIGDGGANEQNPRFLGSRDGEDTYRFTDQFGENHFFHENEILGSDRSDSPFVPREFLIGKAILVFWPMPPFSPVPRWRLIF